MTADERYMRLAISLAKRAEGLTSPNPLVGAVIVKAGKIVGQGYHKACGLPHAEVNALATAGKAARGATLYVTLEPCDHFGRTPPCTDVIIRSGIRRVVVAMKDPNPVTDGNGIRKLKRHRIAVTCGVLEEEAIAINKPFTTLMRKKRPYVTLKMAQSIDGKIATRTGESKWISSEASRAYVHALRGKSDMVMVGSGTAVKDDPTLLSSISTRQPARIIIDSHLKTPVSSRIFSTVSASPVFVATLKTVPRRRLKRYESRGVIFLFTRAKNGMVDLKEVIRILGKMNVTSLLVEGGGTLAASLIDEGLVDHLLFFIAPKIIGGRNAPTSVEGGGILKMASAKKLINVSVKRFEDDVLIEADLN